MEHTRWAGECVMTTYESDGPIERARNMEMSQRMAIRSTPKCACQGLFLGPVEILSGVSLENNRLFLRFQNYVVTQLHIASELPF